MGGGLEYNPYELQPAASQDDAATQARNASLQADANLQPSDYQRAQYQPGQVEKPYGNSGRAVYGGDVQQTYNPGVQNPQRTANNGQWRAVYGGDVGTTYRQGTPQDQAQAQNQQGQWRKPYGADSPLVVPPNGNQQRPPERPVVQPGQNNGGEVDPLTGQPLRRPAQPQGNPWDRPANVPGQQQQTGDGRQQNLTPQQQDIANKRRIVDQALDYNTVGWGGNLVAGGLGGIVGRHTVPWIMDKVGSTVKLDAKAEPTTFRERAVRYWQDNHDPARWNRADLEFARKTLDGADGLASKMKGFHAPTIEALETATERAKLMEPFTKASSVGNRTAIAEALETVKGANTAGSKPFFTAAEIEMLEETVKSGKVQTGVVDAFNANSAVQQAAKLRHDTFQFLADSKNPVVAASEAVPSRLRTVTDAINAQKGLTEAGGKGLFTASEMAALQEYQTAAKAAGVSVADVSAMSKFKETAGRYGTSFIKGAGIAGTVMIADHYADKWLFGKNHGNGIGDSINSVLVPMAFLAGPKKTVPLIATSVGALVVGKTIGASLPEGEQAKYSRYFRQSTGESLLLGAEFLLPMKAATESGLNWKRGALMAGTWAAFRLKNAILDPAPQSDTKDQAFKLLGEDAKRRTDGSMNDAINKFGALGAGDESHGIMAWTNVFKEGNGKTKGARGEAALQVYRTEWLTKPTSQFGSMLEANRGAAILTTAFAESRLGHGTHVPTITDTPTYLLEGKNLDLGGKAARDFIIARINLDNAKKQVQDNLGKEIAGKTVEQSELADIDNVKKRVEANEAKIYGEHDMAGAVKELAHWGQGLNATHMAKLEVDLRNTIAANQNSTDNRYKAKLFRDLATIYLSSAYAKQDGDPQSASKLLGGDTNSGRQALDMTGQQRGFDGALDCIARAHQLDPNNPDVAQLYQIAQEINAKLPSNIQKQMNQGKYNPLQIRH
ncbi:MAG TPA: hypothetical protein EYN91_02090 [Candidatus Melainabacteria bacterium]|nr:hypothetical protein [Candidatus Melainabacteria bacterium]